MMTWSACGVHLFRHCPKGKAYCNCINTCTNTRLYVARGPSVVATIVNDNGKRTAMPPIMVDLSHEMTLLHNLTLRALHLQLNHFQHDRICSNVKSDWAVAYLLSIKYPPAYFP